MEAKLYQKQTQNDVICNLCYHHCVISVNERGLCGVRENQSGELIALTYGLTVAVHIDPIEKKPLYHFLPGTKTYSIATVGCNMNCLWCQNYQLSQQPKPNRQLYGTYVSPDEHIQKVISSSIPSISYTYTEPTVYFEYALDIMKLAHNYGIFNIWVSNGYMTDEAIDLLIPYLDAINIDYKGSDSLIYEQYCQGDSQPVLSNIQRFSTLGIHIEVTTLIVPGVNDNVEQITKIASELARIDNEIPWHITRFYPAYKIKNTQITPKETLESARDIGYKIGMKYIYIGNMVVSKV